MAATPDGVGKRFLSQRGVGAPASLDASLMAATREGSAFGETALTSCHSTSVHGYRPESLRDWPQVVAATVSFKPL
jgi:hypothetical protein